MLKAEANIHKNGMRSKRKKETILHSSEIPSTKIRAQSMIWFYRNKCFPSNLKLVFEKNSSIIPYWTVEDLSEAVLNFKWHFALNVFVHGKWYTRMNIEKVKRIVKVTYCSFVQTRSRFLTRLQQKSYWGACTASIILNREMHRKQWCTRFRNLSKNQIWELFDMTNQSFLLMCFLKDHEYLVPQNITCGPWLRN